MSCTLLGLSLLLGLSPGQTLAIMTRPEPELLTHASGLALDLPYHYKLS